jgi:hypothetical protein
MKFSLYPTRWLADKDTADDEHFDKTLLPFDVTEGVSIEDVSQQFHKGMFDIFSQGLEGNVRRHTPQPS